MEVTLEGLYKLKLERFQQTGNTMDTQGTVQPNIQPNVQPQVDYTVLTLAKAIRQKESQGNYSAVGDNGNAHGAWQWQTPTWKEHSRQILGDSEAVMSEQNQKTVAYGMMKKWKDAGLNPAQIAAKWNSGSEVGWENKIGFNDKIGVEYNVPKYVKEVMQTYQKFKSQTPELFKTQTAMAAGVNGQPNGLLQEKVDNRDMLQKTGDVVNKIFPGKQVGESIGTLGGYAITAIKEKLGMVPKGTLEQYDTSAPTPLQTVADVAQGALMVGSGGMGGTATKVFGKAIPAVAQATTGLGRIGQAIGTGGAFSGLGSVAEGETDLGTIGKEAAIGGAIGGAAGITGEMLNNFIQKAPKAMLRKVLPALEKEKNIEYALKNIKVGTPENMFESSVKNVQKYKKQIDAIVEHSDFTDELIGAGLSKNGLIDSIIKAFPNLEMDERQILKILRTSAGTESGLVTKLFNGTINGKELNQLRSALGANSFKTKIDTAEIKKGKDVAAEAWKYIRNTMSSADETVGTLLSNESSEFGIQNALKKSYKKGTSTKMSLGDWVRLGLGHSVGGIGGAIGATAGASALSKAKTPLTVAGAKLIEKTAPLTKTAVKTAQKVVPLIEGSGD